MTTFIDCMMPVIVALVPAADGHVADKDHIFITSLKGRYYVTIRCDDNNGQRKYQERIKPEYPQKKS